MINIVVPMAGAGSRFAQAGYTKPKPLIEVHGVPMIQLVTENIRPRQPHRFIYICQRTHVAAYGLREALTSWSPNAEIIEVDGLTEGAACTVLCAKALINNDTPLMIANSDQFVDCSIDTYLDDMARRDLDGLIMTMQASDSKWSYAALDDRGLATLVVEKQPISTHATVGIYNFRRGTDFVAGAEKMIADDLRTNNEFYVAPVYNICIAQGARIGVSDIGAEADGMYGLGTPADLDLFLSLDISRRVTSDIHS